MRPANPLFGDGWWHRRVIALAIPIMLSNVSTPVLGLVDTAVIGNLGDRALLGAVGVGAVLFNMVFGAFIFLRMGTTGLTAQARGAGNRAELPGVIARAGILAVVIGLGLIALQAAIGGIGVAALSDSPDVAAAATTYFSIRIWGAPFTLANYAILGWLLGVQRAGTGLALQLVLNLTNIVLDLVFVAGLGWGIAGVAWASVAAEATALCFGTLVVMRLLRRLAGEVTADRLWDWRRFRRLLSVNADIFIRTLCLVGAFGWFTAAGSSLGEVPLGANAVLLQFLTLTAFLLDGYAHAAETLCGDRAGARDRSGLVSVIHVSSIWAVATAIVVGLAFALGGPLLIDALTNIDSVRAEARAVLPWLVLLPLVAVWSYQLDGIFIGVVRTRPMRNAMIVSLLAFMPIEMALTPWADNHGLWAAFTAFFIIRAGTLALGMPGLLASVGPPSTKGG